MVADRSGRVRIGWIREDTAHDILIKQLAAKVAADEVSWFDIEHADALFEWHGLGDAPHLVVTAIADLDVRGPGGSPARLHGHINGQPLAPEASMWRKGFTAFAVSDHPPNLLIIARDCDGYGPERRRGFEQVATGLEWPFDAILAMPTPEAEAWFIAAFVPANEAEQARVAQLTTALSFNPTVEPHRLTAHPNDAPTDAKRVLDALTDRVSERCVACLDLPLDTLCQRGRTTHLADFIDDLRRVLPPLVE